MTCLESPAPESDLDPAREYHTIPASDRPGCFWVVLGTPSRSRPVGYLEPAGGGTFRAFYGDRTGERLGRAETIEGGVNLVALYRRARLVVDWCRTWGHLDALHDRAEDLPVWV